MHYIASHAYNKWLQWDNQLGMIISIVLRTSSGSRGPRINPPGLIFLGDTKLWALIPYKAVESATGEHMHAVFMDHCYREHK